MTQTAQDMDGRVVYEAEGAVDSTSVFAWLGTFAGIGLLTATILAFIMPGKLGSGWLYLGGFVALIAFAWWRMGRGSVVIKLVDRGETGLSLVIDGPGARAQHELRPEYEHWAAREKVPARLGGGVMCHYGVVVRTTDGETIAFRQMGGEVEPPWPERDQRVDPGPNVYMSLDIFSLEAALRDAG